MYQDRVAKETEMTAHVQAGAGSQAAQHMAAAHLEAHSDPVQKMTPLGQRLSCEALIERRHGNAASLLAMRQYPTIHPC